MVRGLCSSLSEQDSHPSALCHPTLLSLAASRIFSLMPAPSPGASIFFNLTPLLSSICLLIHSLLLSGFLLRCQNPTLSSKPTSNATSFVQPS